MAFDNSFTAVTGATYTAAQYNTYVRDNLDALFEKTEGLYPIGVIIELHVSTNPNTLFGFGTWAALGAGRVTVGIDAGDTDFDTVGETGGSKTHTLSISEMPAHTHTYNNYNTVQNSDSGVQATAYSVPSSGTSGSQGGGGAHNNVQPYVVVYRWRRTT